MDPSATTTDPSGSGVLGTLGSWWDDLTTAISNGFYIGLSNAEGTGPVGTGPTGSSSPSGLGTLAVIALGVVAVAYIVHEVKA